jgi:hypothetical protein
MKKLLCSAAAAAALLCGSALPSSADTCAGTCITTTIPLGNNPNGASFNDQFIGASGPVTFTDVFNFTLTAPPSDYSAAVIDLFLAGGSLNNFTISVVSEPGGAVAAGGLFTFSAPTEPAFVDLGPFDLTAPGSYAITVTGTTNGLVSYGGSISTLGETPLPGTLALFAGGLGLLGFAGRRKRGNNGLTSLATAG